MFRSSVLWPILFIIVAVALIAIAAALFGGDGGSQATSLAIGHG
jgi:hypothetical protein